MHKNTFLYSCRLTTKILAAVQISVFSLYSVDIDGTQTMVRMVVPNDNICFLCEFFLEKPINRLI